MSRVKKPNAIAEAARKKIAGNPELEAAMREAWSGVQTLIEAHIEASPKKWKAYEAHHVTSAARLAMLTAFVDGKSTAECGLAALRTIGQ
ncbi:hypothetical protein D3227_04765 [Mesorhizobium waimense]|uniref:Uncharacterized protein n=1 Tax=Mesorhizobium waimense TaxID=1300307 RepID=A0A3A5L906_9HYPH|nr:hypothetical protein [Mesorhizobium waimense]RJT41994.1 hypothetical protein D3227_04765 [Mesorhizobium waimense]